MKNMGFSKLSLVNSCNHLVSEAYQMAYGAHDVLEGAKHYATLSEAISTSRFVIGLTGHAYQHYEAPLPIQQWVSEILSRAKTHSVAILFGSEATGLSKNEIPACHRLALIPTTQDHTSLNLAQAVIIVLYELQRSMGNSKNFMKKNSPTLLAPIHQTERFYKELGALLEKIGFIKGGQGESILLKIRRVFSRTGLTLQEARLFRGMVHEILMFITHRKGEHQKGKK